MPRFGNQGEKYEKNRKKPELFFAQHCNLFTLQSSSFSENKTNVTISQMAQITADESTRGGEKKKNFWTGKKQLTNFNQ